MRMKRQHKEETPEQEAKRKERNQKARERHWRKTGVGSGTINWMRDHNCL